MTFLTAQSRARKPRLFGDPLDRAVRLLFQAVVHHARHEHVELANVRHEFLNIAATVGPTFPNLLIEAGVEYLVSRLPGASRTEAQSALRTDLGRLFGRDLGLPDLRRLTPEGRA